MDLYDDELSHGVLRAGQELLWTAASLGNMSDVQGLVSMKCPLDVANPHEGNSTPLIVASRKGHFDVVQFLMRKGADVRLVTDQGHTALHAAAESANLQVVKYLLANAADGTAFARLKDKRGRDAATVAKDCRANLVQRLLGKYLQDPKSCGLAPDRNLQLARLARERESRSRGVATADASDSAARQGNPRPQPQRPGIQHTGASATVSRRRAATAPDPHVNARKKRGIFGLRDLPQNSSSSDSDSEGSSSTVASDEVGRAGDDAEDYDDDDDDGDMQGDSGDDSVSVGESGNGMLDDSDLADMGLGSLPDSPTRDRALMLQRIDESMIPDAVRAAARRVYLASYTQWRKGSLPRPHRLEEAIELGKAALEDRPGVGSAAASHHERRAEKQGRATRSRADGREERRAARKANLRPSIYRDDGSLSPSAAASVTGHGNSGGGGGGASHTSAFHRAKQDAAWASLGHETTLDAAAQIEYYKAALKNEKAAKVDLRRQLKQLRKKLKASASKVAATRLEAIKSLEAELQAVTSELSFRKGQNLVELSTQQLRELHDNMKAHLEVVAKELMRKEVEEKLSANATREVEDKELCVICCSNTKTVLLLPCRHLCLCDDCVDALTQSDSPSGGKCPMCREVVQETMKVFS